MPRITTAARETRRSLRTFSGDGASPHHPPRVISGAVRAGGLGDGELAALRDRLLDPG
jgi:hypothetical protein